MTTTNRLPTPGNDDVDRLLSAYYQTELPARWPAAPRPWADKAQTNKAPAGNPTARSRWALAASVALLLGGCWYLSGQITDGRPRKGPDFGDGPTANLKHMKDLAKPKADATPKMP